MGAKRGTGGASSATGYPTEARMAGRLLFGESGRKEAHDARQDEHCPGSRVTVFLLQITEQEVRSMKRRLTILTLTTLAAVALIGVVWTAPSPAFAGGATQISGVARFAPTRVPRW